VFENAGDLEGVVEWHRSGAGLGTAIRRRKIDET